MFAKVIADVPVAQPLDYRLGPTAEDSGLQIGRLCVVPIGARRFVGVCVDLARESDVAPERLRAPDRALTEVRPLDSRWLAITRFASEYYQCSWGEVAVPSLPPMLREVPGPRFAKVLANLRVNTAPIADGQADIPTLSEEQSAAVAAIRAANGFAPVVLYGVTGSGKTEVYLAAIDDALRAEANAQCLLLVPEINLTPRLVSQVRARFPDKPVVGLHSGLNDRERSAAWLAAHESRARIVVGTRLAVFASLPHLRLIVVDEEHDTSYKAGDGVRYSARDLAVKRAQIERCAVVLGSATPSLETWAHAQSGRYRLLRLTRRIHARPAPTLVLLEPDMAAKSEGICAPVQRALEEVGARGEQSLVFINRRGFAPVLCCGACGWLSNCRRCSAFAAFHKVDATLRCHHCGWTIRVPRACPTCGNQDLVAVGQGTQRVEETLRRRLAPELRIARIDRDSTRRRGTAQAAFEAMHAGTTDVLIGTQMIAKGHDFQRVTLVVVLNADAHLVSHDFRAPERLFALLLQVAGRAGRTGLASRVQVQTRFPRHPLFAALVAADFEAFASAQLEERRAAGLPPFVAQALLIAAAAEMSAAMGFLDDARRAGRKKGGAVRLYDPVPMPLARIGGRHRAQLLVEADQRAALLEFLARWLAEIRSWKGRSHVRWHIDVDPSEI